MDKSSFSLSTPGPADAARRASSASFAYIGCYTTALRQARGDGINVYEVDGHTGAWRHVQRLGGLENPSFLVLDPGGRRMYAAHGDLDHVTAHAVDPATGALRLLNRAATGGLNSAHLALDASGRWLITANYGSGDVSVLAVRPDGSLVDQHQLVPLAALAEPQHGAPARSHPHQVVFDPSGQFVLVPDKGLDRVFVFQLDDASGRLKAIASVASRPGAGPRHLAFHPSLPVAWVINELDSSVATYRWDIRHGRLEPTQVLTTLPPGFTGANLAAEIVVAADGRHVYCSNRGSDTVAVFAIDAREGRLRPVQWEATGGRDPRFITFDAGGECLLSANEQGDSITRFRIDRDTGRLTPTGQALLTASPSVIVLSTGAPGD